MQKASVLQALLQFVRFGLPWDFRTTITIARGGGALRRTFRHSLSSPATRPRRGLRSWDAEASANGWRVTRYSAEASHLSRAAACWIAGRNRAMGPQIGKRRADAAQRQDRSTRLPKAMHSGSAATSRSDRQCQEKECRQYPGLRRTRASANTSGPDSTLTARPLVKLQNRKNQPRTERRKLVSSAGP